MDELDVSGLPGRSGRKLSPGSPERPACPCPVSSYITNPLTLPL